jgi:hypothetical protein
MENKYLHIALLKTWLFLPFFFYNNCILANIDAVSCEYLSFSKMQKSVIFDFSDNSNPFKNDVPKDSSENHLLSNVDVEEIVEPFALKNFTLLSFFSSNHYKLLIRKSKDASNIQFYLDIVPPPPKR